MTIARIRIMDTTHTLERAVSILSQNYTRNQENAQETCSKDGNHAYPLPKRQLQRPNSAHWQDKDGKISKDVNARLC